MSYYAIAILGAATPADRARLQQTVSEMVEGFGLEIGRELVFLEAADVADRDIKASTVGVYFADGGESDLVEARALLDASVPIIPSVAAARGFDDVPGVLSFANGLRRRVDDPEMRELASAALECAGLLRRQRRVFISYRRVESSPVAIQLHDLLTSRGFDVFLDTHGIRPGDPFQDMLWHKLVDSDVLVMLDTPGYFDSAWTRQEIGRARAIEINVLRVVWPGHEPERLTDISEPVFLNPDDLEASGKLTPEKADSLVPLLERLRSRSIASRYRTITGKLQAEATKVGAEIDGVGAHRAIGVKLFNGHRVWAFPIIGVPTAETLNDIATKSAGAGEGRLPILLYDHLGIRGPWLDHLKWLDDHIAAVKVLRVSEVGWELPGLEGG